MSLQKILNWLELIDEKLIDLQENEHSIEWRVLYEKRKKNTALDPEETEYFNFYKNTIYYLAAATLLTIPIGPVVYWIKQQQKKPHIFRNIQFNRNLTLAFSFLIIPGLSTFMYSIYILNFYIHPYEVSVHQKNIDQIKKLAKQS